MWDQYKKTFIRMQSMILVITVVVFVLSHLWNVALTFFAIMQVGSALGAMWGSNLRHKILAAQYRSSLPRT